MRRSLDRVIVRVWRPARLGYGRVSRPLPQGTRFAYFPRPTCASSALTAPGVLCVKLLRRSGSITLVLAVVSCEQVLGLQSTAKHGEDSSGVSDATCSAETSGPGVDDGADLASPSADSGGAPSDANDDPESSGEVEAGPEAEGGDAIAEAEADAIAEAEADAIAEAEGGDAGLPAPLAYWSLDRSDYVAPRTVVDRVGGFDGLFAAPSADVAVPGLIGEALQFHDFSPQEYQMVVPPRADDPLELTGAGTISVWAFFDTLPSGRGHQMALVDKGGFGTDETLVASSTLLPEGGYGDVVYFSVGQSTSHTSEPILQTGVWFHIVGTFKAYGSVCIYVNGVLQLPPCTPLNYKRTTDVQPLKFSGQPFFGGSLLSGRLDEVAIWSVELSEAQVQMLHQLGRSGTPLVGR